MGKYKFKLSDMIPNSWFYKLKYMASSANRSNKSTISSNSNSKKPHFSNFDQKISSSSSTSKAWFAAEPARRSRRKTIYKPSPKRKTTMVSANLPFDDDDDGDDDDDDDDGDDDDDDVNTVSSDVFDDLASCSTTPCKCKCNYVSCSWNESSEEATNLRISTKPNRSLFVKFVEGEGQEENEKNNQKSKASQSTPVVRKSTSSSFSSSSSVGVKLRSVKANSPRMAIMKNNRIRKKKNKKNIHQEGVDEMRIRKLKSDEDSCILGSFAVIKASDNPQHDFRESMVEMIIEKNITSSKDLEDLLASYLILNSDEYHHLIINTFEKIWFDMAALRI